MIQYEWAMRDGQAIQIEFADKGSRYTCIGCGNRMVARKGRVKAHHFGHFPGALGTCSPETVLHINTKYNLAAAFQAALGHPYDLIVRCAHNFPHKVDLLSDVERVETEKSVGEFRPDISLLASTGDVKRVVEVEVTHAPDVRALSYYHDSQISVYVVKVSRNAVVPTDLKGQQFHQVDTSNQAHEQEPLRVYSRSCACSGYYEEADIYRFDMECYSCHKNTPVVIAQLKSGYGEFGAIAPKALEEHLIQRYPFVKRVFSKTQNQTVLGNVCTFCGGYNGNFFVSDALLDERGANDLQPTETKGYWSQSSDKG